MRSALAKAPRLQAPAERLANKVCGALAHSYACTYTSSCCSYDIARSTNARIKSRITVVLRGAEGDFVFRQLADLSLPFACFFMYVIMVCLLLVKSYDMPPCCFKTSLDFFADQIFPRQEVSGV